MANITVKIGLLAKPLKSSTCKKGTTLEEFLKRRHRKYDSSVRVDGDVRSKTYVLKAGDIVSFIGAVSGGF